MNEKLLSGLITGFIDESLESISTYKPTILSNDYLNNSKVLNEIIYNLKNCDEFWFCSSFLTMSGYTVLANTLDELKLVLMCRKFIVSI